MKHITPQYLCIKALIMLLSLASFKVFATCSSYAGFAVINEVHRSGNSTRFVELEILNTSISSSVYNNWTINICNYQNQCSGNISLVNATTSNFPWMVIDKPFITSQNFIDLSNGMDIIFRDAGGNTIDYLSVAGYTDHQDSSCTLPYDTTIDGSNSQNIARSPDGTGNWAIAGSGNSGSNSQNSTNDVTTGGTTAPIISVSNVTVPKGQTANFTLSISSASTYNITVSYQTRNATALAGTDYTAVSGTATILAGATSTTISVPTTATSSSGEVYFYVYLYNQLNGSLNNHFPIGTILANPLAAWNFEEAAWSGTTNEVIDSTSNGYHGTATNGADTANASPAVPGSPGTCRYGVFDGSNDYIALSSFPNLTGSFTITAWIRATRVDKDQRILADDQNNSGGYAFSLGDNADGQLRFFSRNISPVSLDSPTVISSNTWYHVAAVHNVTNKTRQIFVNGASVTSAQTYTGTWGTDTGAASIGGENNSAGSEAVSNWRFTGNIDDVRVYNSALNATAITAVMNETRDCANALHHFQIEHDGTGLTCNTESITIRACTNSACTTEYPGNVTVTLSPSGWVGGDTINFSGGHTTVSLRRTTAGAVTLATSSPSPNPTNSTTCLNTSNNASDCTLTFYDTGFIYSIPTQTSCTTSSAITVSAVRLDNTTQQCIPAFANRNANVNFWNTYASPASGTRNITLNNGTNNYTLSNAAPGTSVPLSFNGSGQATITLSYNDAGQTTLNSQFVGSGSESGLTMNGATTYVTKPYKLYVFSDDANADCAGAASTCSVFKRAGEAFNLKIRGACADNSVTPNFQLNGLTLSHTNIAPAIAQGSLGVTNFDINATDNGEHVIATQSVSEVGVFTFTAQLLATGYFGETIGDAALNTSAYIGRFIPDHFCIGNISLLNRTDSNTAASCTDAFNYLGEDFDVRFRLSAQRMGATCTDGTLTQNYSATWSHFTTPFTDNTGAANEAGKFNFAAVNDPGGTPTNLSNRIIINSANSTPASGQFSNGMIDVSTRLQIARSGSAPSYTAETPFNSATIAINPIDTDNVRIDATNLNIAGDNYRQISSTTLYFGRLYADNAYGPENLPLAMWAQTQSCSAVFGGECMSWTMRNNDSCTLYSITTPAQTALGNLSAGDGQGYYRRAAPAVSSGTYDYTSAGGRVHVPDTFNHSAGWRLYYTGGGNGGDFLIPFSPHPYLRIQNGTASFGQFRGDDRIIYWRELFQ